MKQETQFKKIVQCTFEQGSDSHYFNIVTKHFRSKWRNFVTSSQPYFNQTLGELERRHIPNFSVNWHHLASFDVKRRHLTSMTPNLTSLTLNFSSLTLIWRLWRQFGTSGADLVSLAQTWRHWRQVIPSVTKRCHLTPNDTSDTKSSFQSNNALSTT